MDFLKKQLDAIQQNLAGLNATQKMLTGTLVVIMVLTMVLWGRYAGTAEMEPVLNSALSEDEIARITASLDMKGIPNKVVGGKVMVPTDKKFSALAELGYQQLLPRNSKSGFDEMFDKLNAFHSPDHRAAAFNRAREMTLSQIIGGFPNVARAEVMIADVSQRRIGGGDIKPSATINITTRGGPVDKKLALAAADMVTGAVSNMDRHNIKVVIDARPVHLGREDDIGGGVGSTLLEVVQAWEAKYCRQIEEQLSYYGNVRVSVTGAVNVESMKTRSREVDAKKTSVQPRMTQTTSNESTNTSAGAGDTSVGANIGAAVTVGSGGQSNTSVTTSEKTENQIDPSWKETDITRPPGEFTALQASVRLPRTYFEAVARRHSSGKEPSEAEVDAAIQAQLPKIREAIAKCTNIRREEDISVDTYYEISPLGADVATAGVAGTGGGVMGVLSGWGKEVAVGVLAVISLFMVSTMVKKSTPAPLVVTQPEARGPSMLDGGEDVAGLATEGGPQLAGMELDDDTIQTQQILDQVQQLVGENPDAAANLVKRWLNRQ